jgi:hypothetical protein
LLGGKSPSAFEKKLSSHRWTNFAIASSGKSPLRLRAILSHQEGRLAIATNAGQGAVDAGFVARRAKGSADGEAVWSRRLDAGVKLAAVLRIALTTVAIEPGHRGERGGNR